MVTMDHTQKVDNNIAAVQFEIELFKYLPLVYTATDFIYMDIYCKLWTYRNAWDRLRVRL